MKKVFLSLAALAFVATGAVSCSSDDGGSGDGGPVGPIELEDNQIAFDNEVYDAVGGYFTVYGNTETGEVEGTYTWSAEDLGIDEDLLVSEWNSFQVLENEAGEQYMLLTGFDIPFVEGESNLPTMVQSVISYSQRLYYMGGANPELVYQANGQEEPMSFNTFVLGQFGQTEQGEPAHEVTDYSFNVHFSYDGEASPADFLGGGLLYVEDVNAQQSVSSVVNTPADRLDRAMRSFDMNRISK